MLRQKEWGGITRASMLIGSLSAAAFVFGATAGISDAALAAGAQNVGTPATEIGRPIKPLKQHVKASGATVRTLSQIQAFQAAHPSLGVNRPAHRPLIPMGEKAYREAKRQAALAPLVAKPTFGTNAPPPAAPTNIVLTALGPKQSDPGNGYYPPDSTGAIGGGQIVAPVNLTYNVYNRAGAAQLNTTFNALLGTSNALSDPRVVYDPIWKRWVISLIDVTASATDSTCFWLVISTTSNAKGPFYIYHPCVNGGAFTGGLWDYDILGMSQDAVMLTGNLFGPAPSFSNYYGAVLVSISKAVLYNGQGFSVPIAATPATVGTLTPPIIRDSNANAYFIGSDSDGTHVDLYRGANLSNDFQFSFVLQAQISSTHAVPPSARQPGTAQVLDTLDGRFQQASTQYGNSLWNVHTTALGSFPAPYFYQIDTNASGIIQSGYFFEGSTSDDFNPSIAANPSGDAFVTWSSTDALATTGKHNARVRFSGRQAADTLGSIGVGSVLAGSSAALTGNYQSGVQRWGDYSAVFLDSTAHGACSANQRAAIFNEKIVDANTWGVAFGIVGFC